MENSPIYGEKEESRQGIASRTCRCGDGAPIWTAWSDDNPSKRFTGCPNYKDPRKNCHYFSWIDPELPEASKRIILAKYLRSKIELQDAQMKKMKTDIGQSKVELGEMIEKAEKLKAKCTKLKDQNHILRMEMMKRKEREKWYLVSIAALVLLLAMVVGSNGQMSSEGIRFLMP